MGVTELAKIKISNCLGPSAKIFKNLTFEGGRSAKQKKDYSFSNAIAERGVLSHIEPFVHSVDDCVQA